MIAALWSNPNWDDTEESKGARQNAIEGINGDFAEAIEAVDSSLSTRELPEEEKLSKDNPFFAAAERGLEKIEQKAGKSKNKLPHDDDETDYTKEIDQS